MHSVELRLRLRPSAPHRFGVLVGGTLLYSKGDEARVEEHLEQVGGRVLDCLGLGGWVVLCRAGKHLPHHARHRGPWAA